MSFSILFKMQYKQIILRKLNVAAQTLALLILASIANIVSAQESANIQLPNDIVPKTFGQDEQLKLHLSTMHVTYKKFGLIRIVVRAQQLSLQVKTKICVLSGIGGKVTKS